MPHNFREMNYMTIGIWVKSALFAAALVSTPLVQAQSKKFEPTAQVAGQSLQINGHGTRYRAVIPVYEIAFYTTSKATTAEQLLTLPGPKRVSFIALRDIATDQLGIAMVRGMRENADPSRHAVIAGFMDKLSRVFSTVTKVGPGQTFRLDYVPGKGTTFYVDNVQKGETVSDAGFIEAMLRIWVGPRPVDSRLKDALLGAPPKSTDTLHQG